MGKRILRIDPMVFVLNLQSFSTKATYQVVENPIPLEAKIGDPSFVSDEYGRGIVEFSIESEEFEGDEGFLIPKIQITKE